MSHDDKWDRRKHVGALVENAIHHYMEYYRGRCSLYSMAGELEKIKDQLAAPSHVEPKPVAWRYRTRNSEGGWSMWTVTSELPHSDTYEYEAVPLYEASAPSNQLPNAAPCTYLKYKSTSPSSTATINPRCEVCEGVGYVRSVDWNEHIANESGDPCPKCNRPSIPSAIRQSGVWLSVHEAAIIAAAVQLAPLLEAGWDDQDAPEDQNEGAKACDALVAAVNALLNSPDGGGA